MNIGILGGGFGIYGWLSALKDLKSVKIHTLDRYKENVLFRKEFSNIKNDILWNLEEDVLKNSDILIIARRPVDQYKLLKKIIKKSLKCSLILEKPIAPRPDQSESILEELIKNQNKIIINFTLAETGWGKKITKTINSGKNQKIIINWSFMAHHYNLQNNNTLLSWKAIINHGGGALRFYCIHLIHLFSVVPEWKKVECSNQNHNSEDITCNLRLVNDNIDVSIICDTKNKNQQFTITSNDKLIIDTDDPFVESDLFQGNKEEDRRVFYLKKVINKAIQNSWFSENELKRHIRLWKKIEDVREIKEY